MRVQYTLSGTFTRAGVGLHSGTAVRVHVSPAPPGTGRTFVRSDLPGPPEIAAEVSSVGRAQLSTMLGDERVGVRTVEHLLAALLGAGVDNARIELDGPEVPLLDGSAREWSEAIAAVGTAATEVPAAEPLAIAAPLWVGEGDAFVTAVPAAKTQLSYGIDFDAPAIGQQWHTWQPDRVDFAEAIAPARTFALAEDVEPLRQAGLIRGGSLENALVCAGDRWLNPPLRFANEPARHKLLDLVGDLSLLGALPRAHVLAYKASHALHVRFARALLAAERA
ncbi:UDP-3-O-acyl-N-acetylglucosamine deacetylase [Rubidibacter lacunae]|nr:UDP-3-O-acyl-N-acetylglucosamine deacetylase [Rubidibacter lacunae]